MWIRQKDIEECKANIYPDVTEVRWRAGQLDADVLRNFPNLKKLDCYCGGLPSLVGIEGCPQIQELNCSHNRLKTLKGLEGCPGLQVLLCQANELESTEYIKYCPNLRTILCSDNKLTTLAGIEACPLLTHIRCGSKTIKSIADIGHCPQLEELWFYFGSLTNLNGLEKYPNLKKLELCHNKLTSLAGLEHTPVLRSLNCSANMIGSLEGIEHTPLLRRLDCSANHISSLKGIEHTPLLESLGFSTNAVTSIAEVRLCPMLTCLSCMGNYITSLKGIEGCPLLQIMHCSGNRLTSLEGIQNCKQIQMFSCGDNRLTSLEQLVYLPLLTDFNDYNNPLDVQTIQTRRFLTKFDRAQAVKKSVYDDEQNVHNIHIQTTVCESIQRLLKDSEPKFIIESVLESSLPGHTKQLLTEYCADETVHSAHLLTYQELLGYVWARIMRSPHSSELLTILAEQISDSECKCFTGRINRTLSVLVGFYDDIVIEISNSSRISAIILAVRDRIESYDPHEHRTQAQAALLEAGYDANTIDPWLGAISEP